MPFHFYISCYVYYDNVKLETCHISTLNDLHTSTGKHITILNSITLDNHAMIALNLWLE